MKLNLTTTGNVQMPAQATITQPELKRPLLIVDDEEMLLMVLSDIFQDTYDLKTAKSGEAALELIIGDWKPEVIIADQRMNGMSGAQFLAKSIDFVPNAVRVILTGYTDVQDIIDSINLGNVYRFMTKPWQREELVEAVRLCYDRFDLTTQNTELQEALRRLKELDDEKDELLGIVAHDLKNPLQAIREYALMCNEDDEMPADIRKKLLDSVVRISNRMFAIIKNLLDLNALERGSMSMTPMNLPIHQVVAYIVQEFRSRAEAKNLSLQYSPNFQAKIFADESMTIQILENLLSNAIKYSPTNKKISVELRGADPSRDAGYLHDVTEKKYIVVSVRDEGPGISEIDMPKLFGKFVKLAARPTAGEDSTGLGLSIVKKMAENLGGMVWCESVYGEGATFFVALPEATFV